MSVSLETKNYTLSPYSKIVIDDRLTIRNPTDLEIQMIWRRSFNEIKYFYLDGKGAEQEGTISPGFAIRELTILKSERGFELT